MALINCPECGKEISEYAYKCPNCGAENQDKKIFDGIDITEEEYETKFFSYAPFIIEQEKKEEQKKRKKQKFLMIILACFMVSVAIFLISHEIMTYVNYKRSVDTIEFMCSLVGQEFDEDGTLSLDEDDRKYMEHSKIYGVKGNITIPYEELEDSVTNVVWGSEQKCTYDEWLEFENTLDDEYGYPEYCDNYREYTHGEYIIKFFDDEMDKIYLSVSR